MSSFEQPSIESKKENTNFETDPQVIAEYIERRRDDFAPLITEAYAAGRLDPDQKVSVSHQDLIFQLSAPYRRGKQQPVVIAQCQRPDGQPFKIVLKSDHDHLHQAQQQHPELQKHLPKIYADIQNIAAIEFVSGAELGPYADLLIKDPSLAIRAAQESLTTVLDLADISFSVTDADWVTGHNIILESDSQRFRLFDIHAVHRFDSTVEEILINRANYIWERFAQYTKPDTENRKINSIYLSEFIRGLVSKRDGSMQYQGEIRDTLAPGDPGYDERYDEWSKRWTMPWSMSRTMLCEVKQGTIGLNPTIIELCRQNDLDGLSQFADQQREPIITKLIQG